MKKFFFLAVYRPAWFFLFAVLYLSCGDKPGPNAPSAPSFTWTVGGTTYTAETVYAYLSSNTIIAEREAGNPANKKHVEILLAGLPGPGFTQGAYTMANGGGNTLAYGVGTTPPNNWPYSASGTLNITMKSGNAISGNFNLMLNGANGPMTGSFTGVQIQ